MQPYGLIGRCVWLCVCVCVCVLLSVVFNHLYGSTILFLRNSNISLSTPSSVPSCLVRGYRYTCSTNTSRLRSNTWIITYHRQRSFCWTSVLLRNVRTNGILIVVERADDYKNLVIPKLHFVRIWLTSYCNILRRSCTSWNTCLACNGWKGDGITTRDFSTESSHE